MSATGITINFELVNGVSESTRALHLPNADEFTRWLSAFAEPPTETLSELGDFLGRRYSVAIRLVDAEEIRSLNKTYREKDAPTNILSFPANFPDVMGEPSPFEDGWPLGDMAICASIVLAEASRQQKTVDDHWAHLTIHGVLHLLGFDHQSDAEANEMESLEIQLLASLGIGNPYVDGG